MTVSITNVARGVRLARDSGVPLSDILENRNFTTLDIKDRAAVVKEYATSHEVEARPLDTKQRIKTLAAKAAWGALTGAATGLPVAMVVRSGFLPLSMKPAALLTGAKMALADKSVQMGVGLMAGLGGAQGIYNSVRKFSAQEGDRKRIHEAMEKIRSADHDEAEASAYGAMFGSVRKYDDPKDVTHVNPVITTIGQLAKPYEKAINNINAGRLYHEADTEVLNEEGRKGVARMIADFQNLRGMHDNIAAVEAESGEKLDAAVRNQYLNSSLENTTDHDIELGDRAAAIAMKAKMLKAMFDEVNNSSVLTETHRGAAESLHSAEKELTDVADMAQLIAIQRNKK